MFSIPYWYFMFIISQQYFMFWRALIILLQSLANGSNVKEREPVHMHAIFIKRTRIYKESMGFGLHRFLTYNFLTLLFQSLSFKNSQLLYQSFIWFKHVVESHVLSGELYIYNSNLFWNHRWYSAQWKALCTKITEVNLSYNSYVFWNHKW